MDELKAPIGILTNGHLFEIWVKLGNLRIEFLTIDFLKICPKLFKDFSTLDDEEWHKLIKLKLLTKDCQDFSKEDLYKDPEFDVSYDINFRMLLNAIQEVFELVQLDIKSKVNYFMEIIRAKIKLIRENNGRLTSEEQSKYKEAINFENFFVSWSNQKSDSECQVSEFVMETAYVFINRILLIRICEDKKILIPRKISDGGIKTFLDLAGPNIKYYQLIKFARDVMEEFYSHLYQDGIFDWYLPDDEIAYKVIHYFNKFNFENINRDILGKLYEQYLDPNERESLGQFYTPDQVVTFILDSINYTHENNIDNKMVLDPACGSGAFLVQIVNRLITRYKMIGWTAEVILEKVHQLVYGFDINAFAVHIAEMNLLFQLIDIIAEVKLSDPNFTMKRLNIFKTDSLSLPIIKESHQTEFPHEAVLNFENDYNIVNQIKMKKQKFELGFQYIVGNPPYGIDFATEQKAYLSKSFPHSADFESSQFFTEYFRLKASPSCSFEHQ